MANQVLRDSARYLLDGKLGRRAFVSRLAQLGVAAPVASAVASSLRPAQANLAQSSGRVLQNKTGGELTAEFLLDWEIPYVFGVGGSEEVGFLDALVDRLELQYVLALHEGSAMSMADGYARASGKTAFVNLHSVAGTGYALGPLVNAFKDGTPVVVTAGRQGRQARGSNAFLEAVNLHMLPRDYTRWTWDVLGADSIPDVLRRAFLLARVPPGGPTFVTFSKDLWEERVAQTQILPKARSPVDAEFLPDPQKVSRIVDWLLESQFPLIVAGRELSIYGGTAELAQIAQLVGAPVMGDIPASHSPVSFSTTHPLYTGLFTLEEDFPPSFDLFWTVGGTMFTQFNPSPEPLVKPQTRTIHTSIDPTTIGRNYPVDLAMTSHTRKALEAVLEELRKRRAPQVVVDERRRLVEDYHEKRRQRLMRRASDVWEESPIAPERLAVELNRQIDADAIVVSELATSDLSLWNYLDFHQSPQGRHLHTSSGGCLGWGVGAAIGVKIAQPKRQVVLLVGDGSFQFGVQALWTAARYEVPVAIVIWNNSAYQANRRALHNYGGRAAKTGKYIGCYLGFPDIDHSEIARGYGVQAEQVKNPQAFNAALDRCFKAVASGRPYVLDVKIQPRSPGADSTWYDFFSVAREVPRQS